MKKAIFNNGQELEIQSLDFQGKALVMKTLSVTAEALEQMLTQKFATKSIVVEDEFGAHSDPYEGYTEFQGIMHYTGGILGGVLCKEGESVEERLSIVEGDVETVKKDVEEIKENGGVVPENYSAVFSVAKIQAQTLTDKQALAVKSIYDTWYELVKAKFTAEKAEYKFTHEDVLYKTVKAGQEFQAQWVPGEGTESIFTRIDEAHAGTIEDPIPAAANMEYIYGKYYIENKVIYICKRGGITDEEAEKMYGQKVTLQYPPSQLVGQYFAIVTE